MKLKTLTFLGIAALVSGGCDSGTLEPLQEESLALSLAGDGIEVMQGRQARPDDWIRRLVRAVHDQGDSAALALLEDARALRDESRVAHEAGDDDLARSLMDRSRLTLFEAIVVTFPDAPDSTGAAVDEALARVTERLGDRDAPRIRQILADVADLRVAADAALAAGDPVGALDLNFQATRLLTRLAHFVRGQRDGGPGGGPRGPDGQRPPEELSEHVSALSF